MNIIDNKKKFKDTLESYANNIFKYKLSNKPNKFNTSSNDLKKEYKKLTKLRKDINDLIENDPNDARLAYINLSTPLMHETIEKYEEVLVENGEPIMEQPKESENPAQSSAQPVLNDAEAIRASKKEQRRLMKEKKNKMKLQAKLAQQEAFNNKQIMITEKSAKDIVIEIPTEPTTPTKSSEEPDNESLRVEAVPKVKKNEEKKKKKESNISGTVVGEKNISNTDTSLLSNSKPASSGLGLAKKIAVPKPSLQPVVNTITSSPVPPKTVEWSELATQRKLKEQEEKQKEERLKFEQVKMKKQKEDREKYLKDKFTVPSVFMKLEVPQNTVKSFETADSNVETTSVKYTVGKDNLEMKYSNENLSRQQQITTGFKNHINQTHPELPDSLKQMFTDLHTVRNSSFKNFENPEEKPKWFGFKETQEDMDSQASNDIANANTNNNTSSHGIVITGRRQDKDNGTDEKEKTREQKGNNFEFGFSFTHGLISNIFEQCVNKDM